MYYNNNSYYKTDWKFEIFSKYLYSLILVLLYNYLLTKKAIFCYNIFTSFFEVRAISSAVRAEDS